MTLAPNSVDDEHSAHDDVRVLIEEARRVARHRRLVLGFSGAVIALVVALITITAVALAPSSPRPRVPVAPAVPPSGTVASASSCAHLSARLGPPISASGMEEVLAVALVNTSTTSCTMDGYPTLRFLAGSHVLSGFIVQRDPEGAFLVTTARPRRVSLRPRGSVVFAFTQSACQQQTATVTSISIQTANDATPIAFRLPRNPVFNLCTEGVDAYSNHISLTPYEPTIHQVL